MTVAIAELIEQFEAVPSADLARTILEHCARDGQPAPLTVLRWTLSRETWDDLPQPVHDLVAEAVRQRLDQPVSYLGIYECSQGEQRHRVAMFVVGGARFALIPGGRIELGWKRTLLEGMEEVWQEERDGIGHPHLAKQVLAEVDEDEPPEAGSRPAELYEWLNGHLSSPRTVVLAPYLIECKAQPMESDYPEEDDESDADSHDLLARQVTELGFRLPTPDEWEHACSGGSRHLFRWGPFWPVDVNIYDVREGPELGQRNAFGLLMNADPYRNEVVASPEQLRGGDGGELVCGGAPDFASWLTAMSAYVLDMRDHEYRDVFFEDVLVRRALSVLLPQETDDQQ